MFDDVLDRMSRGMATFDDATYFQDLSTAAMEARGYQKIFLADRTPENLALAIKAERDLDEVLDREGGPS